MHKKGLVIEVAVDWTLWRKVPPGHLVTMDEDAYAATLLEAGTQEHAMEERHVGERPLWDGTARYSRCVGCGLSVWVLRPSGGMAVTRLQPGLARRCTAQAQP